MWFNRPVYYSYTPSSYGYWSPEDPYARAISQERAARERDTAARHAELLRWQQMQDAARSPYNSYLSDGDDSSIPYPYNPHANDYATYEDLKRRQILEQQRQLESARQAEHIRRREERRVRRTSQQRGSTFTSAPHFPIPITPPGGSPQTQPTRLPDYPSPPRSPKPVRAQEATPEQIRAAMTIQEFYRSRSARKQTLASIAELATQFEQFKSTFSPPPQLDYRGVSNDDPVTIPVSPGSFVRASSIPSPYGDAEDNTGTSESGPGLAFTSNNRVVLEYIENLNRLLDKLDRIESGGHASVREQRKQMIRNVEAEAQRMDHWIAAVWKLAR